MLSFKLATLVAMLSAVVAVTAASDIHRNLRSEDNDIHFFSTSPKPTHLCLHQLSATLLRYSWWCMCPGLHT